MAAYLIHGGSVSKYDASGHISVLSFDAAKTTTACESSQCDHAQKSLRGALFGPPNPLFQMSQEDSLFRRTQRLVKSHPCCLKKDSGLGIVLSHAGSKIPVDGCMDVAKLDVKTRWLARTWLRCDGAATQNEWKDEEIGHSNSKCTGV